MADPTRCEQCGQVHERNGRPTCRGHSKHDPKKPCTQWPVTGHAVCRKHGAASPQAKAAAERRLNKQRASAAIARLGLSVTVDPQQALLDLVHEAAANVAFYRMLVGQLEAGVDDPLEGRLLAKDEPVPDIDLFDSRIASRVDPENWRAAPHVLVAMYDAERDRLAKYAKFALDAGLAEREVQLAERQGEMVVRLVVALLDDPELALTFTQRELGRRLAGRILRELSTPVIEVKETG